MNEYEDEASKSEEDETLPISATKNSSFKNIFSVAWNTKSAYVQTHERNTIETQTEPSKQASKEVQVPHYQATAICSTEPHICQSVPVTFTDPFRLASFLLRAEKIMRLVDDVDGKTNLERQTSRRVLKLPAGSESYCTLFYKLIGAPMAKNSPVRFVSSDSQHIYSVQNTLRHDSTLHSLITLWPTDQASCLEHMLMAHSTITCVASDERGNVCAGTEDGSLALWDLCESTNLHKNIVIDNSSFSLRSPSYSSACVANDSHKHPVVSVHILPNSVNDTCLLASVDRAGIVIVWELQKVYQNDLSYSEQGEGMQPGSSVKLLKKSTFSSPLLQQKGNATERPCVTCSAISSELSDHVYVGTNHGQVIRASRFTDDSLLPTEYKSAFVETIAEVTAIAFSQLNAINFLVGYIDGVLALFTVQESQPEQLWDPSETLISEIVDISWDCNRSSIFAVLDVTSSIFLWDLAISLSPLFTFSLTKLTCMTLSSKTQQSSIVLGTVDGNVEVLQLNARVGADARDFRLGKLMTLFGKK